MSDVGRHAQERTRGSAPHHHGLEDEALVGLLAHERLEGRRPRCEQLVRDDGRPTANFHRCQGTVLRSNHRPCRLAYLLDGCGNVDMVDRLQDRGQARRKAVAGRRVVGEPQRRQLQGLQRRETEKQARKGAEKGAIKREKRREKRREKGAKKGR